MTFACLVSATREIILTSLANRKVVPRQVPSAVCCHLSAPRKVKLPSAQLRECSETKRGMASLARRLTLDNDYEEDLDADACRVWSRQDQAFLQGRNINILVADDRPDIRSALDLMLRRLGIKQLRLAIDGADLLRLAHADLPDLVISDVDMPTLDGLSALDQLPRMPCIMISGLPVPQVWCERNSHRLVACLRKPFRSIEIQRALCEFVTRFDSKPLTS